jgi:hypothetical protein
VRFLPLVIMLACLAGCASEYSRVPEPTGAWVPANPPRLTAEAAAARRPTPLYSYWLERGIRR